MFRLKVEEDCKAYKKFSPGISLKSLVLICQKNFNMRIFCYGSKDPPPPFFKKEFLNK